MRSTINLASKPGIAAIVAQQFEVADQISAHGLMPIIEPEISIKSPDKAACEALLRDALLGRLDALPKGAQVMLKLTLPEAPDFYMPLIKHAGVARVVALSGGYTRADACRRLAANHGMIASFSRALTEGLTQPMSDAKFDAALAASIDEIYRASADKVRRSPWLDFATRCRHQLGARPSRRVCGFGTIVGDTQVSEDVVSAKFEGMRDGAAIASRRLWS